MKKYFVFLFLCFNVLMILFSGCVIKDTGPTIEINGKIFKLEIADDIQEQYQGLSNRESLDKDSGMLFMFDNYQPRTFVMRDMNFMLDIVWIKDNQVVDCARNVPILTNGKTTSINSQESVNYILELNAGMCDKYNIKSGDAVDIKIK